MPEQLILPAPAPPPSAKARSRPLRRRVFYQTRHTFASNALAAREAPSWVAAMLGHTTPEMLFTVYARYIPNRTRRDGSALLGRMAGGSPDASAEAQKRAALLPIYSR
jgi:integrase